MREIDEKENTEISCPHCQAVYCVDGKMEFARPYACKACGRMMYVTDHKLIPGPCDPAK